jgi:hypothetical protein
MSHRRKDKDQRKAEQDAKRARRAAQVKWHNEMHELQEQDRRKRMALNKAQQSVTQKTEAKVNFTPPAKDLPLKDEKQAIKDVVAAQQCLFNQETICNKNYECSTCDQLPREEYDKMQARNAAKKRFAQRRGGRAGYNPRPPQAMLCSVCSKQIGIVTSMGPQFSAGEGIVGQDPEGKLYCQKCKPQPQPQPQPQPIKTEG